MLPNLKLLREKHGISQQTLAAAVNSTQQSINKYENHNTEPDIQMLGKIADYFGVSIDYLAGHTDIPSKAGAAGSYALNEQESGLIARFRTLEDDERTCVDIIVKTFSKK